MVRQPEYVATLGRLEAFQEQLNRCYAQSDQGQAHRVVFLGDEAAIELVDDSMLNSGCR
ncbi:MAG: hypothetical protein AAF289_11020 [Cyanobacteria bacterium P01_A01_bin.135]